MNNALNNIRGSVSLTALASLITGCCFVLLLANLLGYVVALQSVEHAAGEAVRCLSTLEGSCLQTAQPDAGEKDWFAVRKAAETTEWADRYNYHATLYRETWEARGNGFQIHLAEKPLVEWQEAQLPVRVFRPSLNQYEHRETSFEAVVLAEVTEQHYRMASLFLAAGTNFPDFDAAYEVRMDNLPESAWRPRVLVDRAHPDRGFRDFPELPLEREDLGAAVIAAGSVQRFSTGFLEVPLLPSDSPAVTCTAGTAICDVRPFAGASGVDGYSWDRKAALALKLFAAVRRIEGSPTIAWAGAPGAEGKHWGLEIETISASEYQQYLATRRAAEAKGEPLPPLPPSELRCLGGRSAVGDLPMQATRAYNLWLRGPKGSNGGGDPNCPLLQNTVHAFHDALFVDRGGAFRVSGYLSAGGSGAVRASVSLQHGFDTYEPYTKTLSREKVCRGMVRERPGAPRATCEATQFCGGIKVLSTKQCAVRQTVHLPICETDAEAAADEYAFSVPKVFCGPAVRVLACNENIMPEGDADCHDALAANPERAACHWLEQTRERSWLPSGSAPAGCSAAKVSWRSEHCGTPGAEEIFPASGDFGDPHDCRAVRVAAAEYANHAESLRSLAPELIAPAIPPDALRARWNAKGAARERWAPALELPDSLRIFAGNPQVVRAGEFHSPAVKPIYRHTDAQWKPPISAFGFYALEERKDLSNVELIRIASAPVEVTSVYPFSSAPEREIPDTMPGAPCSEKEASLEARLREYASREVPEAGDEAVVVETSASYVDTIETARSGGCKPLNRSFPAEASCTKTRLRETRTVVCEDREYLGRFSDSRFPHGPPICSQSPELSCFTDDASRGAGGKDQEHISHVNAARRALQEIHRSYPDAALSCTGPLCAAVSIDTTDQDRVGVAVQFQLPVRFPLSTFLGKETLPLRAAKSEILERRVAGRLTAWGRGAGDE